MSMTWEIENVKQAYGCNREILKHFREKRGWTQSEFSRVVGYSERLISKAESGRSISSETVSNLAEALSTKEEPVYPEDLVCDPVESAKRYVAAIYEHQSNFPTVIRHLLDDEVVFQIAGDPEQFPFAGRFEGMSGIQTFADRFFSILQSPENHDPAKWYQYIARGNEVVVWGESWIHPIGQPMEKPMPTTNLFRFRRGKIVYLDDRYDTQLGAEAIFQTK